MKNSLVVAAAAVSVSVSSVLADAVPYELGPGETDTLSESAQYSTMRIAGDLTVNNDAVIDATTVNLVGGTVYVDGAKTSFCSPAYNVNPATFNVTNGEDGVYGKITVRNGSAKDFNNRWNFGAKVFNICTNAPEVTGTDGCIDFLDVKDAVAQIFTANNYSTLTGRVTVAGTSNLGKRSGYAYGGGIFCRGPFIVDLKPGTKLSLAAANQQAGFNEANVPVTVVGSGDLAFEGTYNGGDEGDNPYAFRAGARFLQSGEMTFSGDHVYLFAADDLIGPGVTCLRALSTKVRFRLGNFVRFSVRDLHLGTADSALIGDGTVNIDCSTGARTFIADVPERFALKFSSADHVYDSHVTVTKTGSYEATVVSTNLLKVRVFEGTMRFAQKDCTVRDLYVDEGAEVVVDGVMLTLDNRRGMVRPVIRTINGGKVVCADGTLYDPGLSGLVHVQSGTLSCSAAGYDQKFWRFTFKGTAVKPAPLHVRNLFLLGDDHTIQNYGSYSTVTAVTEEDTSILSAKQIRWRYNSATNVLATGKADWQNENKISTLGENSANGNNFANLTAPVVNREDPVSHLSVELRLPDTARPITGYSMTTLIESGVYADLWDVYASSDGLTWTRVDTRDGEVPDRTNQTYVNFDGYEYSSQLQKKPRTTLEAMLSEYFRFTGYTRDGLVPAGAIQAQVEPDATLDLTAYTPTAQPIDGLVIDATTGGGTIKGGAIAAAGRIMFDNIDYDGQGSIPFTFDGTAGLENLANWKVFAGDAEMGGVHVSYDSKSGCFTLSVAFVHITESGSGDLPGTYPDQDLSIKIDAGVVYTNETAFAGSRSLSLNGAGTLVLAAESPDYSGGIGLGSGILSGPVSNAFGTGTIVIAGSTTGACQLQLGSETRNTSYPNDIVLESDSTGHPAILFVTAGLKQTEVLGSITANGYLMMTDSGVSSGQSKQLVFFRGDVNAAGRTVEYSTDNSAQWFGVLRAGTLMATSGWPRMGCHELRNGANEIGRLHFYYIQCRACAAGAFGGAELRSQGGNVEIGRGFFDAYGYDQTIAALTWTGDLNTKEVRSARNAAATLTITGGVAYAKSCYRISGEYDAAGHYYADGKRFSLTVDAGNADFVQELTNAISSTFGDITIRRGALRLTGTSSFTNAPTIAVEGGRFELDGVAEGACLNATNVTLGANAALKIGAGETAAFGTAAETRTLLRMETSSKLELPEGAAVTVRRLDVGGQHECKGVYTGVPGDPTAAYLPQIEGNGRLTVLRGGGLILILR